MTYFQSDDTLNEFLESGIGYQEIEVKEGLHTGLFIVLNNMYWFPKDELQKPDWLAYLTIEDFLAVHTLGGKLSATQTISVPAAGKTKLTASGTYVPPPFSRTTKASEKFYRLSAFSSDHCILSIGPSASLRANTYTIPESELKMVPSGLAAVGRYALPSRVAAIYCWEIVPTPGTPIYVGTVIPNFGMAGGGVEVFFPAGFTGGSITPTAKPLPEM